MVGADLAFDLYKQQLSSKKYSLISTYRMHRCLLFRLKTDLMLTLMKGVVRPQAMPTRRKPTTQRHIDGEC